MLKSPGVATGFIGTFECDDMDERHVLFVVPPNALATQLTLAETCGHLAKKQSDNHFSTNAEASR